MGEVKHNELISKKQKNVLELKLCSALIYFSFWGHILCFCFWNCFFRWYSFSWYYKFCSKIKNLAIISEIKKYKTTNKKKRKKHDKLVLLEIAKFNAILISKALIDSFISHDEFVSMINFYWNKMGKKRNK